MDNSDLWSTSAKCPWSTIIKLLLYINELPDYTKYWQVKISADDTKIDAPSNCQAQHVQSDIHANIGQMILRKDLRWLDQ